MQTSGRSTWIRAALGGLAAGLLFLAAGDRPVQSAIAGGIDPFEILKLQVRNNVLFVVDTSGSMAWPLDLNNENIGGDDPMSRLFQAKQAVEFVTEANRKRVNFGLATYTALPEDRSIQSTLVYASVDATAQSFMNANFPGTDSRYGPYPAGCTPGTDCRYYWRINTFQDSRLYDCSTSPCTNVAPIVCPVPPAGAFSTDDTNRPCFQARAANGDVATFYYSSTLHNHPGSSCSGAEPIATVNRCEDAATLEANVQEIFDQMQLQVALSTVNGFTVNSAPPGSATTATPLGLRAGGSTPVGGVLDDIRNASPAAYFPPRPAAVQGLQKNFVILLTDGDDTCSSTSDPWGGSGDDARATNAAIRAERLFNSAIPQQQAETIVIAFTTAINKARADTIARAGSGGTVNGTLSVSCPAGVPCRDAYLATSLEELIRVLQAALELATSTGEFSASGTTAASVYELGPIINAANCVAFGDPRPNNEPVCADILDPNTRYNNRVNALYLPTFQMPNWEGHLYAYINNGQTIQPVGGTNFTGSWDAGETLFEQVSQVMEATDIGRGYDRFTFAELHGGATARNIGSSTALIKRRIFTSSPVDGTPLPSNRADASPLNREYARAVATTAEWDAGAATGSNAVALWPPNQVGLTNGVGDIDPPVGTPGPLDQFLGIATLTYGELRQIGGCMASSDTPAPAACNFAVDPTLATDTARKEARQILLAWLGGAKLALSLNDGGPLRDMVDVTRPLIYQNRGWLLLESALSQSAVIGPPVRSKPLHHKREWLLYTDGRRDGARQGINETDLGYGLVNPDFDDTNPAAKLELKPVMTIVYIGADDGLHAFRAGPNCANYTSPGDCAEGGSNELWSFVPLDQLHKLRDLRTGQKGDPHVYMVATSPRVSEVFVPGEYTLGGVTFYGRWRRFLYIGRGPGEKYLTAIDITAPGPFTRNALETNPPWVAWQRGNDAGIVDELDGMGYTWSVPAIGNVPFVDADLDQFADTPEWRLWMGSGPGDLPEEGSTFYTFDAVTGDVLLANDVGDGDRTYVPENALVGGPSAYNRYALEFEQPRSQTESSDYVSHVYIPDVHGRIWKFNTVSGGRMADRGAAHPFGVRLALLKFQDKPHIYASSGNDNRVPDDGIYSLFGYRDDFPPTDLVTPFTQLFVRNYVDSDGNRYKGTVAPATGFSPAGAGVPAFGRVFSAATRFNDVNAQCLSRFDTLLLAVSASSGSAVYDFNGDNVADISTVVHSQRTTNLENAGGRVILGDSGALGDKPRPLPTPPGPSGLPTPAPPQPPTIKTLEIKNGSPVCRAG